MTGTREGKIAPVPSLVRKDGQLGRVGLLLAAILVGCVLGFAVGRQSILHTSRTHLANYASRLEARQQEVADELEATLVAANSSREIPCSAGDMALLRRLTFTARFLKDVGRTKGDLFLCSAMSGKLAVPKTMPKADLLWPDGWSVYRNNPLNVPVGDRADLVGYANANAALSPEVFSDFPQEPIHYATGIADRERGVLHLSHRQEFRVPDGVLESDAVVRRGDSYFAGRCSMDFPICAVAFVRANEIWQSNQMLLAGYATTGTIAGALCGVALLLTGKRRRSHTNQLKRAILMGNLSVAYQPIVEMDAGRVHRIVGAEALARWTDEDGESIRPEIIVALAEAEGFVSEITRFVLTRSLQELRPLLEADAGFQLNINLAPTDLADPRLLMLLDESLRTSPATAANLAFELTERTTTEREVAVAAIRRLRERGHSVYIDDFGTGYSNLAYLSELNVDGIKINRSFIATIGTEAVTASIIPQILELARALGLSVVVQGIEREEQAAYFVSRDQPVLGQGWFFGLPVSARSLMFLCSGKAE